MKKKLILVIATIILLILVLANFDIKESLIILTKTNGYLFLLACSLQLLTITLIGIQWFLICRNVIGKLSFWGVLSANLYGTFFQSITPSAKLGGEVTRVLMLKKLYDIDYTSSTVTVGLQKTVSIFAFMILSGISIFINFLYFKSAVNVALIIFNSLLILILVAVIILLLIKYPGKIPYVRRFEKQIAKFLHEIKVNIKNVFAQKGLLYQQLLIALLIWLIYPLKSIILAEALGIDISPVFLALATYIAYTAAMVPLLPGGIGSFEAAMSICLIGAGVEPNMALALSILIRLVTYWFEFLISTVYVLAYELVQSCSRILVAGKR